MKLADRTDRFARATWLAPASLAVLGIAANAGILATRFVQDELPLVLRNEAVHSIAAPGHFFSQTYWHNPFPPALYRPLTTLLLALEWLAGKGEPLLYRAVSLALLLATGLAVWRLGRIVWPGAPAAAWTAAALFLVDPLHVEALVPAVNQAELAVGLITLCSVAWYLNELARGRIRRGSALALGIAYFAATLFKESGLVLPGFLLAAQLVTPRSTRGRVEGRRELFLLLALAAVSSVALRASVLGPEALSTPPADALRGASASGRALTMLAVVPQWIRLLFWPARLQADYGPNEIVAAAGWGSAQWAGLLSLLLAGAALLWSWKRRPVIALGLCWIGIALLPVSNVLVPTGIVLAERTLFLSSAGAILVITEGLRGIWRLGRGRALRLSLVAGTAALLALAGSASARRAPAWRDQGTLLQQTVADAPKSYAAHLALSRFLEDSGSAVQAQQEYRRAAELNPGIPVMETNLADQYRLAGLCEPAARHYRRALSLAPEDIRTRTALVNCLLSLRRFAEARETAAAGLALPAADSLRAALRVADSALAAGPKP